MNVNYCGSILSYAHDVRGTYLSERSSNGRIRSERRRTKVQTCVRERERDKVRACVFVREPNTKFCVRGREEECVL